MDTSAYGGGNPKSRRPDGHDHSTGNLRAKYRDVLIKGGVKAILNYAPISFECAQDFHIESVDPIVKLQHMTFYLEK
jgi:hypothetical protein